MYEPIKENGMDVRRLSQTQTLIVSARTRQLAKDRALLALGRGQAY